MTYVPTFLNAFDMVITPDGNIGLLTHVVKTQATVQFDAAGSSKRYHLSGLRRATEQEIQESGLEGVGCNQYRT